MLLFIILSTILLVFLHWFLISPYGYWKKRGVPAPKPTILLGNLGPSLLMKKNLGQIYEKIYNEYKNYLYVGYYKLRKPGIIIRDTELIKSVLIKDFPSFHDNDFHVDPKIDPLFGNNPFCLTGKRWKDIRSLVTSGITTSKVKNMFYLMSNVCNNLVKYLEKQSDMKKGLDAKEIACSYTTDVVASCAFGLEAGCLKNQDSEFRRMGSKFIAPTFWFGIKFMIMFILPSISKLLKFKLMPTEVEQWFMNIIKDTMKYRKENNVNRHDYLDMLMGIQEKSGNAFDDICVAAQALTFYGDGFETSAITIAHALYELAENPEIQIKLRNEIDTILAKHNGEITYDCVQEMTYLDNVLHETLRKDGPVLFISRLCTKQIELPPPRGNTTEPNVTIEPGTPIIIPAFAIHHDATYYPNPEKFDPDRFNENNKASRPKCAYLAFGEGPRYCLGSKFGIAQSKAALVAIISNFEITVNPKTQRPLQLDPNYFMTNPIGGLWLNFTKRSR